MFGDVSIVCHSYKVERDKKQYSVYELIGSSILNDVKTPINPILPKLVRVEKFRNFSMGSGFDEYFRIKTTNNWQTSEQVTGMFKTNSHGVYYGDRKHNGKRNLLIFQFNSDRTKLRVDYYCGFCPYNKGIEITPDLQTILNNYVK